MRRSVHTAPPPCLRLFAPPVPPTRLPAPPIFHGGSGLVPGRDQGMIFKIIIKYMKLDEDDDESADVKEALRLWVLNKVQGEHPRSPRASH